MKIKKAVFKVRDKETKELSKNSFTIEQIFLRDFEVEFKDGSTLPPNDLEFWFKDYECQCEHCRKGLGHNFRNS